MNPPARARSRRPWRFGRPSLGTMVSGVVALALGLAVVPEAAGEYGDVVLNRYAESQGVRPVVFPHWFHRIRFRCKVCHSELGFKMRAGANDVQMNDILDGRFCGMCHNNQIAWGPERCDLCHSGKPGLKSGIHGSNETKGPGRW
jgi:c(7)-type cytochrome triheme protein